MARRLIAADPGFPAAFDRLLGQKREVAEDVDAGVKTIIADVVARGDAALVDHTRRLDRFDLDPGAIRISPQEIEQAAAGCETGALEALAFAKERIERFHREQVPADLSATDEAGVTLGWRWTALQSVGIYVPGGTASYPSSVLMNAVPAKVAGVERIAMAVPAPEGRINPLVLAAARLAGVDEVFRIGGAQAVAALAYGTESVAPVAKIVGPGNAWVAAAKRRVFGQVGIDMIAGPSEVVILADRHADPAWIAADLIAQAEHDPAAQAILITDQADLADEVERALADQLASLPRGDIARASWSEFGAIIIVERLADAVPLIDRLAPEHLEVEAENARELAGRVRNAGAIFLGSHTPEAIGDYVGGPNHVLPTARASRYASGLGVLDFMKRTTMLECSPEALRALGPHAIALGEAEGLHGHARSIALRLQG